MEKQNDYKGWPTTRCYPRTLEEAFPQDRMGEWWIAHQRPAPTINDIVLYVLTLLVVGLLIKVVV